MKIKIIALILLSMTLTGCYDRVEMDDRNYVITLGIDKYTYNDEFESEKDNMEKQYNISLGEAELTGKAEATGDESEKKAGSIEVISGTTITNALRISDKYNNKAAYYGQLKTVIFGEELMKDRELFKNAVEELKNDSEVNDSVLVLGCKGDAKTVMESVLDKNTSAGLYIWDFYKSSGREVYSKMMNIQSFIKETNEYKGTCIPLIYVENGNVIIDGSIAVNEFEFAGFLDKDTQKGMDYISGKGEKSIVEVLNGDKYVGVKIISNKTKMDFYEINGGVECHIKIDITAGIEDKSDITSKTEVIEAKLKQKTEKDVQLALDTQDLYGADFMQLKKYFMQKDYNLYKMYNGEIKSYKTSINVNIKK